MGWLLEAGYAYHWMPLLQEMEKHALPISIRASKENVVDKGESKAVGITSLML